MDNTVKPSFTANGATENTSGNLTELIEKRKGRPEAGAAWQRTSKSKSMDYMTIKLTFTKERLQELLNQANSEGISINLVAFPNKNQDNNPKRPNFRIYEELH